MDASLRLALCADNTSAVDASGFTFGGQPEISLVFLCINQPMVLVPMQ